MVNAAPATSSLPPSAPMVLLFFAGPLQATVRQTTAIEPRRRMNFPLRWSARREAQSVAGGGSPDWGRSCRGRAVDTHHGPQRAGEEGRGGRGRVSDASWIQG